jgi:hypothetical protein
MQQGLKKMKKETVLIENREKEEKQVWNNTTVQLLPWLGPVGNRVLNGPF